MDSNSRTRIRLTVGNKFVAGSGIRNRLRTRILAGPGFVAGP
jgi:hypothetical protein